MPEPVPFKQQNAILKPPQPSDKIGELPVCVCEDEEGTTLVVSAWRLTIPEVEELSKTGMIYLYAYGGIQPPVTLSVTAPQID